MNMSESETHKSFESLVGHSPSLEALVRTAQIAAAADVHILIAGETGTGKELLAHAIHAVSKRSAQPFVTVNCAALPHELVESLLFGHEKGAFTGAHESRQGYVRHAHTGTLFLDEIGEMPLAIQAKLLRFIEYGEVHPLGSTAHENVDIRIIAATNRNLIEMVDSGEFRRDLFYRLNVVPLQIPPLRERNRDIRELIRHFTQHAAQRNQSEPVSFSREALEALRRYPWPGNVRELRNVCEHVAALMPGETVCVDKLPLELHVKSPKSPSDTGFELPAGGIDMELLEIDLIKQALLQADGNKSEAARLLGLSRDAFLYRLKKFDL
jgi:two-component system, NtrC family, response regulator HydG